MNSNGGAPGRHWVIIPAAGSGSRMGSALPKQYLPLGGGATVLEHTASVFLADPAFIGVAVVVSPGDTLAARLPGLQNGRLQLLLVGGATRRDTVLNALDTLLARECIQADDWVWVHDAARPGIDAPRLAALREALRDEPCGALLALPVPDTVKRARTAPAGGLARSMETVDRSGLWLAQTPQVFRAAPLAVALRRHTTVTDEASAMEASGYHPRLVPGSRSNTKLTTPDDLAVWLALGRPGFTEPAAPAAVGPVTGYSA